MRTLRILIVAVAVSVAACGGGGDESADPTTTSTTAETTTSAPSDAERASITLEDPGAEPRQALRLQLQEGDASEAI
ncbi:MAG: hypothetical protein KY452_03540 [Actinobacteria bacterium]|nr:hypothetical protein [Actinomycetota bacterium]